MLQLVEDLFSELDREEIRYCHFKSNNNLLPALEGEGDLDVLVDNRAEAKFVLVLARLGFKVAINKNWLEQPFVFHYYGLDQASGQLVHLHIYFRLVTGGSLSKNHWVPVEQIFFDNLTRLYGVAVPSKEVDLILFVLRKFIEQPRFLEHYLFWKDRKNIDAEVAWLLDGSDLETTRTIIKTQMPWFPVDLFDDCLQALLNKDGPLKRIWLGMRVRRFLPHRVSSEWLVSFHRLTVYGKAFSRARLRRKTVDRCPFPGGQVIAFVGGEASGKSTLSTETVKWLGSAYDVKHVHMGKPAKTFVTLPIWGAIKLYSWAKTKLVKSGPVENQVSEGGNSEYLPNPIILLLDAYDRAAMSRKCQRLALNGWIVVTDRYPGQQEGDVDGPRIKQTGKRTVWLKKWEMRQYLQIPAPDCLISVEVPLDVAIERNEARGKKAESADFVRYRHLAVQNSSQTIQANYVIDTSESLERCVARVKYLIWQSIS